MGEECNLQFVKALGGLYTSVENPPRGKGTYAKKVIWPP